MMAFWPRFDPSPGLVADWHRRLPDLVCPGFRLREPRLGDAERLSAAFGPGAAWTMGIAAPGTSDEWMHFVARVRTGRAARHTVCYAVVPDGSAEVGGLVLLQRLAPKSRAAMLSFIFSEAHWETDLPAVSAACVLAFAFEAVGVDRVEGRAGGSREFEAVRRLGAVIEGVLRQSQPVGDGFADQVLWSVLATDWVRPDHSAPSVSVHVEQEPLLPGGPTGGGDVERPAWTVRLPTLEGSVVTLREIDLLDVTALLEAPSSRATGTTGTASPAGGRTGCRLMGPTERLRPRRGLNGNPFHLGRATSRQRRPGHVLYIASRLPLLPAVRRRKKGEQEPGREQRQGEIIIRRADGAHDFL